MTPPSTPRRQRATPMLIALLLVLLPLSITHAQVKLAVIGDFGDVPQNKRDQGNTQVSAMVLDTWKPDFIVTVGDNNYGGGGGSFKDYVGQWYGRAIQSPTPEKSDERTAEKNRFFPTLGNHDWDAGIAKYEDYFVLPTNPAGNERYYDYAPPGGLVRIFVFDSDGREPDDGTGDKTAPRTAEQTAASTQGKWLKDRLEKSTEKWKFVFFHHPAYTSSLGHGNYTYMQLPLAAWGASAVLSGHDHVYERLDVAGTPYFVVGASGHDLDRFGTPQTQPAKTIVRNNADYGALLIEATESAVTFTYSLRTGRVVDKFTLPAPAPAPGPGPGMAAAVAKEQAARPTVTSFTPKGAKDDAVTDALLDQAAATTPQPAVATIKVDLEDGGNDQTQGLLRFTKLFASEGGPIPDKATILFADLQLRTTNEIADRPPGTDPHNVHVHRMLVDWSPATATWSSFGNDGVQADGKEALADADAFVHTPEKVGFVVLDVTPSLQAWQKEPAKNFGWVFRSTTTDGWDFDAVHSKFPPVLSVTWTLPAP